MDKSTNSNPLDNAMNNISQSVQDITNSIDANQDNPNKINQYTNPNSKNQNLQRIFIFNNESQ